LADKTLFFYGFMDENSVEVRLRELMVAAQVASWQQLSQASGISVKRLRTLRRGSIDQCLLSELRQLSQVFQISVVGLVERFSIRLSDDAMPVAGTSSSLAEFQLASIQSIESFLTYWPAAAHQAQLDPDFPARKLLPLVKPIDRLLREWQVWPINEVGALLPFNPQQHQAIDGQIESGAMVVVRYPGYQQGQKLLWRSQVSRSLNNL
jgi:Cro/C1-type HTH DNA-binding domain